MRRGQPNPNPRNPARTGNTIAILLAGNKTHPFPFPAAESQQQKSQLCLPPVNHVPRIGRVCIPARVHTRTRRDANVHAPEMVGSNKCPFVSHLLPSTGHHLAASYAEECEADNGERTARLHMHVCGSEGGVGGGFVAARLHVHVCAWKDGASCGTYSIPSWACALSGAWSGILNKSTWAHVCRRQINTLRPCP